MQFIRNIIILLLLTLLACSPLKKYEQRKTLAEDMAPYFVIQRGYGGAKFSK